MSFAPILIVGLPRSGTTWVGRIISSLPGVSFHHEPDNEKLHSAALYLKQRLHRFPYLRAEEEAPEFERLWELAFNGPLPHGLRRVLLRRLCRPSQEAIEQNIRARCMPDEDQRASGSGTLPTLARLQARLAVAALNAPPARRPGPRGRRVVKSVHAVLALPWIQKRFAPRLLIVRRHPFAIAASYLRMALPDADRSIFSQPRFVEDVLDEDAAEAVKTAATPLQRLGYQLAAVDRFLNEYLRTNPGCAVVEHEALCVDPVAGFATALDRLGLPWAPEMERALDASNRAGTGFSTQRKRHQEIGKWKQDLDSDQLRLLSACYSAMGVPVPSTAGAVAIGHA